MKNDVKIRLYSINDYEKLTELFYNTVHSVNIKDYNEAQINAWTPKNADFSHWKTSFTEFYTIIAEKGSEIAGFGNINKSGYLDMLYIHKNFQRQKIATIIVDDLENYARKNNAKIFSTHSSISAKPFFEKRGYNVIKEQNAECRGQLLINYLMEKVYK